MKQEVSALAYQSGALQFLQVEAHVRRGDFDLLGNATSRDTFRPSRNQNSQDPQTGFLRERTESGKGLTFVHISTILEMLKYGIADMLARDKNEFALPAFCTPDEITIGELLGALAEHADKALVFFYDGNPVRASYHVTEVKAGQFAALDCGANAKSSDRDFSAALGCGRSRTGSYACQKICRHHPQGCRSRLARPVGQTHFRGERRRSAYAALCRVVTATCKLQAARSLVGATAEGKLLHSVKWLEMQRLGAA